MNIVVASQAAVTGHLNKQPDVAIGLGILWSLLCPVYRTDPVHPNPRLLPACLLPVYTISTICDRVIHRLLPALPMPVYV